MGENGGIKLVFWVWLSFRKSYEILDAREPMRFFESIVYIETLNGWKHVSEMETMFNLLFCDSILKRVISQWEMETFGEMFLRQEKHPILASEANLGSEDICICD